MANTNGNSGGRTKRIPAWVKGSSFVIVPGVRRLEDHTPEELKKFEGWEWQEAEMECDANGKTGYESMCHDAEANERMRKDGILYKGGVYSMADGDERGDAHRDELDDMADEGGD